MDLEIKYSEIETRCKLLSSYEAQNAKNASGDTIYQDVIMTDKEYQFIVAHTHEAVRLIEARINSCLDVIMDTDDTNSKITITIDNGFGTDIGISSRNSFVKSMSETIVSWIMSQWLAEKVSTRANAYQNLYENMLEATKRIMWKRKRPTMES